MKDFKISKVYQLTDKVLYYEIRDDVIALFGQYGKLGILTDYNDEMRNEMKNYPLYFREGKVYDFLYDYVHPEPQAKDHERYIYSVQGLAFQVVDCGRHILVPYAPAFDDVQDFVFVDNSFLEIMKGCDYVVSSPESVAMVYYYRSTQIILCKVKPSPKSIEQMYNNAASMVEYLSSLKSMPVNEDEQENEL